MNEHNEKGVNKEYLRLFIFDNKYKSFILLFNVNVIVVLGMYIVLYCIY